MLIIYSFDYIKRDLKAKIDFIEYAGLKKTSIITSFYKVTLPVNPAIIVNRFKDKKGCKDM